MNKFFKKHGEKVFYVCIIMVLWIVAINYCSCESITDPISKEHSTAVYELPYNRHYDHDARFISDNPIDTSGMIHSIKFTAFNFGDSIRQYPNADPTVEFNYVITVDHSDTLYFSNKLNTDYNITFYREINKLFDGRINVNILRYETFKPIDFKCEILYH